MPKAFKKSFQKWVKTPVRQLPSNYSASNMFKSSKRCINSQLMNHLETHKLLSQDQFGRPSKRITKAGITIFVDSIRKNMEYVEK